MKNLFGEDSNFQENKCKCIFTPLGASNHTKEERQGEDFYATPPIATEKLLQSGIEFAGDVWEPACGQGHISKVLEAYGHNVRSTDLNYRNYGEGGVNFLLEFSKWKGDIVTNPPYVLAREFAEHSLEILEKGRKCAMLLKLTFLEGKARRRLFAQNPPKDILVFSERIQCAKNGEFEKYGAGGAVAYAWFVWEKGFKGRPQISWI